MKLEEVLSGLYGSEINVAIKCFWDGGWDIAIGDEFNGYASEANVDHIEQAAEWFHQQAVRLYPASEYVKKATSATPAMKVGTPAQAESPGDEVQKGKP